jgi:hypothetical protein
MNCRYVARDSPRILPGRHTDDCPREDCSGCQPCEEQHCRVCGVAHHEHACPDCMDDTRETITEILRMCGTLPEEAKAKGVNSEAMNLLGPAADWEAANHVEASVLAGRLPADWIDHADHELHPLIVLGGWESVWREEFEHEDTKRQTVADAGAYLDRNLSRASSWPHVPFEDMARDLRRCRSHMEAVLHDGEQVDRGAPCLSCGALLEKRWDVGQLGRDGWACPRCHQLHTADQYDFAMRHAYLEHAEWLTAEQMTQRTGVRRGTVIEWARRKHVRKRTAPITGLVEYAVADVLLRVVVAPEAG